MKLTKDIIQYITLFENVTGASVKDCLLQENSLIFIVEEGNVQKALRGSRKIEQLTKKHVSIIGYSEDIQKFLLNLLYPEKPDSINQEGKLVLIHVQDAKTKGRIFGRSRERLQWINTLVKKYFDIEEVRVN
ncbi:MAG TPA: NusA-like transcription termination signal-binding factor [Candidatus Nanoarchaeia archaeon]|nr:NusA-like transcription termination signal-binding factor [Candidatus Nanoarchaeia archaeon]